MVSLSLGIVLKACSAIRGDRRLQRLVSRVRRSSTYATPGADHAMLDGPAFVQLSISSDDVGGWRPDHFRLELHVALERGFNLLGSPDRRG